MSIGGQWSTLCIASRPPFRPEVGHLGGTASGEGDAGKEGRPTGQLIRHCRAFKREGLNAARRAMPLAWVPRVEGLALPKSVISGNLNFSKTSIRWMSA
jgi:hypothetical protein